MADTYIIDGGDFSGWTERVDGDGTASLANGTYELSAASGRAYLYKRYRAFPGDTVKVYVWAKLIDGLGGPHIDIHWPTLSGSPINREVFDAEDWREYCLTFTVPEGSVATDTITISIGMGNSDTGIVQIRRPRVEFTRSRQVSDGTVIYRSGDDIAVLRPDGVMECWGNRSVPIAAANTPSSLALTFPLPFCDLATLNIQTSAYSSLPGQDVIEVSFSDPTVTGCNLVVYRDNTTATVVHWHARGLWKDTTQGTY